MDEEWFDLIAPESVPGTNCNSSFPSTMLFSWSVLPLRLKIDIHLLKAFSLKTACHHPTSWNLQLPCSACSRGVQASIWQSTEGWIHQVKLNNQWQQIKLIYFLDADHTVLTCTLQLAKLQVRPTISSGKATRSSVEGKTRVPVFNLRNCLLSWCLSLVSDVVMPFCSEVLRLVIQLKRDNRSFENFLLEPLHHKEF